MSCCGKIVNGVAGLAKAALRIDRPSAEIIVARRAACCECLGLLGKLPLGAMCEECGCFVRAKTLCSDETCARGLWPAD